MIEKASMILSSIILTMLMSSLRASEAETTFRQSSVFTDKRCSADDRRKIEKAIPEKALAAPARPRKLLIFDLNVGYPGPAARFPGGVYPSHVDSLGHISIAHANLAFTLMGRKTGAFETVVSRDPSVFQPERLKQFDAVCFNNTVGNVFEDAELKRSLREFVHGGGGLLGIHGASVAFYDFSKGGGDSWPEFGVMLGARGANHREYHEHIFIKLDDPDHPLNQVFGGKGFEYCTEFFRFHDPYSRNSVRVLLSIDTKKTDLGKRKPERSDNDYALAWVRSYGRGRVFYSTIGHDAYVFWDPKMLEFYLGAIQFVLGDLPAPTTPSAKLTPAIRAKEQLD
jgi:type 1 glutamine amidotransferase